MRPTRMGAAALALVWLRASAAVAQVAPSSASDPSTSPTPSPAPSSPASASPAAPSPLPTPHASPVAVPNEYAVKAEFLYNFARFIEWPPDSFRDGDAPFVIAVLGPDPFGSVLDETMASKTVSGRRIEVRRLDRVEEAGEAQIVFVAASGRHDPTATLKALQRQGLLTVGETDGFARDGGAINFTVQSRQVRFEINPRRAEDAGLKMSSQLLKLATLVRSPRS